MECFLCTGRDSVNLKICNATTKYQRIPIASILHGFAGNDNIEIAITNTDAICLMCKLLLDEYDCMRNELRNIQNIIAYKLHRKYQFDDNHSMLPAIRLNEDTANLFVCGNNEHRFQCAQCSFSTDFQDCLLPHSLYHHSITAIPVAANDDFACKNCQLILPSVVLFDRHATIFHAQTVEPLKNQDNDGDHKRNGNVNGMQEKLFQYTVIISINIIEKSHISA